MSAALRRTPERTWTIRQLCQEFGATARALRFYEDKGLLSPSRDGLNRVYGPRDRARLGLIMQGKRLGFSLADLRELLDLYDENDGGAAQMAATLPKVRERITALHAQREDIDRALVTLETGAARLEAKLAAIRPDLLPQADDYATAMRAGLGDAGHIHD